jgi:gluconokinase
VTDTRVHVIVVMGVAGAGKTTAGQALAQALGWHFYDADEFHPTENIEKMSAGHPLTDDDRRPWLDALCALIASTIHRNDHAVLACSALKQSYRDVLVPKDAPSHAVRFVHLDVPVAELRRRLETRHHYFKPELLDSQLAALETPHDALIVDGTRPVEDIVASVRATLGV